MSRPSKPAIHLRNLDFAHNRIEFDLTHANSSFANALRRVMIAEVPTFAFEDCEFSQNTSPLPDEFIAHRIGLCPLISDEVDQFNFRDSCPCAGGCPLCTIIYYIDRRNESGHPENVTTRDFILWRNSDDRNPEFQRICQYHESVKPVEPPVSPSREDAETVPILICKLGPGQCLQVVCKAMKSMGRDHAKWSPCCCSTYRTQARLELDTDYFARQPAQWRQDFVKQCPTKVFRYVQSDESVEVERPDNCTFCRQCQEWLEQEGRNEDRLTITENEEKFIFLVESTGALKPQTIVLKALEILRAKLDTLLQNIQQLPLT
jgi:DNA-directed RNA polymerase II subunit RPB3